MKYIFGFLAVFILSFIIMLPGVAAPELTASRNDYVKMIDNHVSVIDAWTDYEVCNPGLSPYLPLTETSWNVSFDVTKYEGLLDSGEQVKMQIPYNRTVYDYDYTEQTTANGTKYYTRKLSGEHEVTFFEWKFVEFNRFTTVWLPGECKTIRVWGKRNPSIINNAVDNVISFAGKTFSEYAWWGADWKRKREVNVNISIGTTEGDFQVLFNVTHDDDMQADFGDIRFANGSENDELDYFIDRKVDNDYAMVWVEVDQNLTTDNYTFYMYYGNTVTSTTSNPNTTFGFYSDGETASDFYFPYSNETYFNLSFNSDGNHINYTKNASTGGVGPVNPVQWFPLMVARTIWDGNFHNFTVEAVFKQNPVVANTFPGMALEANGPINIADYMMLHVFDGGFGWMKWDSTASRNVSLGGGVFVRDEYYTMNWSVYNNQNDTSGNMTAMLYNRTGVSARLLDTEESWIRGLENTTVGLTMYQDANWALFDNITVRKWAAGAVAWAFGPEAEGGSSNFTIENETYSSSVFENAIEEFRITFWINDSTAASIEADLIWNNTLYTYDRLTENGNYTTFYRNISMPNIAGASDTANFYWNITLTLESTLHQNATSTSHTQTISGVTLSNCSGDNSNETVMWLFLYDEETREAVNGSLEIVFKTREGTGSPTTNAFNYTTNRTSYRFCVNPAGQTLTADVDIEYDSYIHSKRNYYFRGVSLINTSMINRSLYLLYDNLSTSIEFEVKNTYGLVLENVIIHAERYFLGTDEYLLVAMGKTGYDGKATIPLRSDLWYKYILLDNSTVLNTITPTQLTSTTISLFTAFEETIDYFEYFDDVSGICSFNNDTKNIVCDIVDTSGHLDESFLEAKTLDPGGYVTICTDSSTSPTTTLICNIAGYTTNGTVIYTLYGRFSSDTSFLIMAQDSLDFGLIAAFGAMGVLVSVMLVLASGLIGIKDPAVMIILVCLSLVFVQATGLFIIGWMPLVGVVLVGGFIVYLLRL